jgi:hypothetical protein
LAAERHGVARRHRAVRPHFDRQLVVVGRLADTRRFDDVVDLLDRRVDRVDRNPADAEILVEVLVGGHVAAAALQAQLHLELAALAHRRDVRFGFEDFDVRVRHDVLGAHFARLHRANRDRLGLIRVDLERDLLEVEDDVGRVLDHALDGRELVQHALDLHRRHRRTLDRGEQHAPHGVADRRTKPALERLRREPAEPVGQCFTFELETLWPLKTLPQHGVLPFARPADFHRSHAAGLRAADRWCFN